MTGTGALLRLALRLDRVRLAVWVLALSVMPLATAAQYKKLYPTQESLDIVTGVVSNASLIALNGPLFEVSLGALTTWKIGVTEIILVALMSILAVIRHTRTEEESGRLELVGSTVVGRRAPLTAALLEIGLANAAIAGLTALGLIGMGLPTAGSVMLGSVIGLAGLAFGTVAAVAAQLTQGARAATGIAAAVLGGAYLLRAVGDTGPTWLSWASPVGWGMHAEAYAADRWWVLGLLAGLTLVLAAVAYALVARRDVGEGLLPERPAPAEAAPSLRSSLALAWRLQRGTLVGWLVGMAVTGAVLGGAAKSISNATTTNQQLIDMLARLGGPGSFVNGYLGAVFGIIGLVVAAYAVQATLRLRAEEAAGRLEPVLATRVGRLRWAAGHLSFALVGSLLLLTVAGVAGGLSYGAAIGDVGGQLPRILGAALVQAPAVWVLAGMGTLLFGIAPRWTVLTWAGLVACVTLLELGAILGLSQWLVDASPFAHVPKLPGAAFTGAPLLWLTALTVALGLVGLTSFRRRDIG